MFVCVVLSRVQLFVIPWTIAHQAPLSMEFSRQEYWSGLPFAPPGNLPTQEIEPHLPSHLHWQVDWLVSKKDLPLVFPQNTKHLLCQSASDLSFNFTFPFQLQGTAAWYTKSEIHILNKQLKVFYFSISEKGNNRNQTYISLKFKSINPTHWRNQRK